MKTIKTGAASRDRDLRQIFLIVGTPPTRDQTVVLGVLQHQENPDAALRTFFAADRPDTPKENQGWLIRAIPFYPIPEMDRAIGQFYIDAGQPPGPAAINPLVEQFRGSVYQVMRGSLFGHNIPPLKESKWGKRRVDMASPAPIIDLAAIEELKARAENFDITELINKPLSDVDQLDLMIEPGYFCVYSVEKYGPVAMLHLSLTSKFELTPDIVEVIAKAFGLGERSTWDVEMTGIAALHILKKRS